MKLSKLIDELECIQEEHGDIEVQVQNEPRAEEMVRGEPDFFVIAEEYEDSFVCNIRSWPY